MRIYLLCHWLNVHIEASRNVVLVEEIFVAGQKTVLGIHKTQNGVEMLMHRAWVTHDYHAL